MDEDRLIAWLKERSRGCDRWIGDDAAIIFGGDDLAITTDTQVEGVHFQKGTDPALIARRLLAVNLSDLAAMGARPAYAFLVLATPADFDHQRFFEAFLESCADYKLELAGGDLSSSPCTTTVATLLGRRAGSQWVRREGARPGDHLWLGGTIGESAAGRLLIARGAQLHKRDVLLPEELEIPEQLARAARRAVRRHLAPRPQLQLGRWLGDCPTCAAIDLSDGLSRDLHRLCETSKVGAEIKLSKALLSPSFQELSAHLGHDWRHLALRGGEDYVLLFSLPVNLRPPDAFRCVRLGEITPSQGVYSRENGISARLPPLGWDHLEASY